jgi:hypothetical protein
MRRTTEKRRRIFAMVIAGILAIIMILGPALAFFM